MRVRPLSSARFLLLTTVAAIGCGLGACSDDDEGGSTKMAPPSLEILGFRNGNGEAFDADASPVTLCTDGKLAVRVGPSENAEGQLDNWFLRPPGGCGSTSQCGYVVTTVTSKDDSESVSTASASTTIPLDLSELSLAGEYVLRVELHQGKTGEPFLVNDAEVADQVTLSFDVKACPGAGDMGGAGGFGGVPQGGAGPGGLGGVGGALGGMGGQ